MMPTSGNRTGVLLVDDEVLIREGLRLLIDSWPTLEVIGQADTPIEALVAMAAVKPNLIVCSCDRASAAFLNDLRVVVQRAQEVPVVLLTSSRYAQSGALALQVGIDSVISKKHTALELRQALEQIRVQGNGTAKPNGRNELTIVARNGSDRQLKART